METMQPTLKRGRDVWDPINMPETEFQERVKKIKKEMKKEGIDVLLLYGCGPDQYGNPCYISNYVIKMPWGALVIIPQKGEVALIFEGFSSKLSTTWVKEVRAVGDVSKECIKYLEERKLIPSTIGFVGLKQLMPHYQMHFLSESLKQSKIVHSDHIIRNMRMVKSQKESDEIRRCSRILTHAFDLISTIPSPNLSERVLEAVVNRSAYLEGAEDFRMLLAKPLEEKWAFRPAEDGQILPGDSVIVYLAVEFERYWSEGIRTFVVESPRLVQPKLENVKASYERIIDGVKPGKTLSQFYKETIGELQKSKVDYIPAYGLGQGIGLGLQEFPMITEEDESELKEGMCLTLHLAIRDKEMGAIMIGNTVYLSKNGPKVLTK